MASEHDDVIAAQWLRKHGQAGLAARRVKQRKTVDTDALERVRMRARLEHAAAQHLGPVLRHRGGVFDVIPLHRTWSGDHRHRWSTDNKLPDADAPGGSGCGAGQ